MNYGVCGIWAYIMICRCAKLSGPICPITAYCHGWCQRFLIESSGRKGPNCGRFFIYFIHIQHAPLHIIDCRAANGNRCQRFAAEWHRVCITLLRLRIVQMEWFRVACVFLRRLNYGQNQRFSQPVHRPASGFVQPLRHS